MYYKVIKDNRVIDVLDNVVYLKWQPKHKIMVLTGLDDAQAILSSDKNKIWHEVSLYNVPVSGYETVRLEPIDQSEYEELRRMHLLSFDEIYDLAVLDMLEAGLI